MITNSLKTISNVVDLGQGSHRHDTKAKVEALRIAGMGKERAALDFGCGDGFWSEKLKEHNWRVTAADFYDSRYTGAKRIDAEALLPFADNSFDLIWSSEVIEHVYEVEKLIKEFKRITKPGGRIIITTPNSHFWVYYILKLLNITPQEAQNPDHKQFFSIDDMRRLFPDAEIYGYFPYAFIKLVIKKGIGFLSPTFLVVVKV